MAAELAVDEAAQTYIDGIAPEHRPLFDRVHNLVRAVHPDASLTLSYRIPTYVVGKRRLFVGVWKHGISIYGWKPEDVLSFVERHPATKSSKGTIRLRHEDSAEVSDDELRDLIRAALDR
jgi:uncharacterized protein YdhG (YjbR/CyaY superfamily)